MGCFSELNHSYNNVLAFTNISVDLVMVKVPKEASSMPYIRNYIFFTRAIKSNTRIIKQFENSSSE